jgi:hypothetical protein
MTITIRLKTDNAAFHDADAGEKDRDAQEYARNVEVLRILRKWLDRDGFEPCWEQTLHDSNGNRVGSVTVKGK